jgi:GntR family transcriptional regulator
MGRHSELRARLDSAIQKCYNCYITIRTIFEKPEHAKMRIQLDGEMGAPMYRRIVNAVKHQVAVGALAQGERLPTVRQLAQDLSVDRNTIVRAYRILDREGVISLQHGRGTFVKTHARHPLLTRHRQERLLLMIGEGIAHALSLGYAPEEIQGAFSKRMAEWRRARNRSGKKLASSTRRKSKRSD